MCVWLRAGGTAAAAAAAAGDAGDVRCEVAMK